MKQVGNTILAKGGNHILAKRDNSAWPKGSKLSGFSIYQPEQGYYRDCERRYGLSVVASRRASDESK